MHAGTPILCIEPAPGSNEQQFLSGPDHTGAAHWPNPLFAGHQDYQQPFGGFHPFDYSGSPTIHAMLGNAGNPMQSMWYARSPAALAQDGEEHCDERPSSRHSAHTPPSSPSLSLNSSPAVPDVNEQFDDFSFAPRSAFLHGPYPAAASDTEPGGSAYSGCLRHQQHHHNQQQASAYPAGPPRSSGSNGEARGRVPVYGPFLSVEAGPPAVDLRTRPRAYSAPVFSGTRDPPGLRDTSAGLALAHHGGGEHLASASASPMYISFNHMDNIRPSAMSLDGSAPGGAVVKQVVATPNIKRAAASRRRQPATFLCAEPGCDTSFTTKFKLRSHQKAHLNIKEFVCDIPGCDKSFVRKSDLRRHVRSTQHAHSAPR